MGCLNLSSSAAIDKLQPREGTAPVIGPNDGLAKVRVSRRSGGENFLSLLFMRERIGQALFRQGGIVGKISSRESHWIFTETEINYSHKIFGYQWSNGGLCIAQS